MGADLVMSTCKTGTRMSHRQNANPSSIKTVSPAHPVPGEASKRRHGVPCLKQMKALSLLITLVFVFMSSSSYLAHTEIMDKTKYRARAHCGCLKTKPGVYKLNLKQSLNLKYK